MKDLKHLVNNFKPVSVNNQMQNDVVIDQFAKNIINQVFSQLSIIFPAWKHNWKSDDPANPDKILNLAKMEWTKAFNENNINTLEQIKFGFAKARKTDSDFLPSCGKFISWCSPSPEDLGYPDSRKALEECIKHRNNQKMFTPLNIHIRPMIIELCKRVDWWAMNRCTNKNETNKEEAEFTKKYIELINSGYVEPQESSNERLETEEIVTDRMSDEQLNDRRKRHLSALSDIKKKLRANRAKLT